MEKIIFQDASDPNGLSEEAYYFIGGIMRHIKGNGSHYESAGEFLQASGTRFRGTGLHCMEHDEPQTPLIRIPAAADGEGTRIELRSPDSAANPYLTLAVCLSAGLEGIREKIEPPQSINANTFCPVRKKEREELHIDQLPGTLLEAVEELEKDTFIQKFLEIILPENTSMPSGKSGMSTVPRYPSGRFRSICTVLKYSFLL